MEFLNHELYICTVIASDVIGQCARQPNCDCNYDLLRLLYQIIYDIGSAALHMIVHLFSISLSLSLLALNFYCVLLESV